MFMDRQGKVFGKINIIDLLLVLVVALAVSFMAIKFIASGMESRSTEKVRMEFYAEEVSDFVADEVAEGLKLTDDSGEIDLGVITKVEKGPSVSYSTNDKGEWVVSDREGYFSIRITGECEGTMEDYGVKIDGTKYGVGHSFTLRAGKAKIWLRVSGIEAIEE